MKDTFHYLLLCNQNSIQRMIMQYLEGSGLTPGQPKILEYLRENDGCMQKEIAAACQVDAATIVGLLNRMEDAGLLERKKLDGNRRSFYIYLTCLGKEKAEEVHSAFEKLEDGAFAGFSQKERAKALEIMERLRENLTEMEKDTR